MLEQATIPSSNIPPPEEYLVNTGRMRPSNPDNTPSDDRVEMVMRFKSESEDSATRQAAMRLWEEADRLIQGDQWAGHDNKRGEYQIGFIINKMYAVVEKLVSLLIQNIPEFEILPRESSMSQLAESLDNYVRHEYDRNNWIVAIGIALKAAIAHKTSFLKVFWDPHDDGGRGSARVDPVSNYDLYLDDGAMIRDGELQSKYIIHRMSKTRNEIIGKWGVDPTGEYQRMFGLQSERTKTSNITNFIDGMRNERELGSHGGYGDSSSRPPDYNERKGTYEVYECHYRDDSLVISEGYDERVERKLKYPAGRIITVCNGQVLHDGPNTSGFCMFVPITTDPSIDKIYGPSVVTHLAGVQFALNKGFSQVFEHTERCSNPTLQISSATHGLNQDSDISGPGGRIVTAETEGGVGWIDPPPLGPEVMQLIQLAIEIFEDISGIYEVSKGNTSPQARSGVAIDKLQGAAMTRSNLKLRFIDQGVIILIRNVCSLFLDNVKADRMFRFIDEDAYSEDYGVFNPAMMIFPTRRAKYMEVQKQIDDAKYKLTVLSRTNPVRTAQLRPLVEQELQMLEDKKYEIAALPAHDLVSIDVEVQTGTRFMTKEQLIEVSFILKELDMLTPQALFKAIDYPDWRNNLRMLAKQRQDQIDAEKEAIEEQFDLERTKIELEHANDMELEELKGTIELAQERIRQKAKATQSKAA